MWGATEEFDLIRSLGYRSFMRVPQADLKNQHHSLRAEIDQAISEVIDSCAFINGPHVQAFEEDFANFCEVTHAIGVASGTDALALALRASGVGRGDVVATVPFTFAGTVEAILHVGAEPLFVDIESRGFGMDPAKLERSLEKQKVNAIMPVHLYGQPAMIDEISACAARHGVPVIEDAAQAHGARYRDRRVGTFGVAGCFSFYPGKNLGAFGDGGAIVTDSDDIAERVRLLRDHGQQRKYYHDVVGFNSRLDALQAAVLRVKLKHLEMWNVRRREIAAHYRQMLASCDRVRLPVVIEGTESASHLFAILCQDRDGLQSFLAEREVSSAVHYPIPLHRQPAFAPWAESDAGLECSEHCAREVLILPLYPEMKNDAVEYVATMVKEWAAC